MIKLPSLEELFDAGVHFGHQKYRSTAQARRFVFQVRDGVMILDLSQTAERLKQAADFLREAIADHKLVLVVGTKRQFKDLVRQFAKELDLPYIAHRWPGGMLTNFETMKRRIAKYNELIDEVSGEGREGITKKERRVLTTKIEKMGKVFEGIRTLDRLPDVMLVIGATTEQTAITEARRVNVPTVALSDTDANPDLVTYPVPANDDSKASVELLLKVFTQAVEEGRKAAKGNKGEQRETRERANDRADQKTQRANRRAA